LSLVRAELFEICLAGLSMDHFIVTPVTNCSAWWNGEATTKLVGVEWATA
jgi:hypothetical protein